MAGERKYLVGTRLTMEERQKLDNLSDFLGLSKTECVILLINNEYEKNRAAIEAMLASRKAIRGSK